MEETRGEPVSQRGTLRSGAILIDRLQGYLQLILKEDLHVCNVRVEWRASLVGNRRHRPAWLPRF